MKKINILIVLLILVLSLTLTSCVNNKLKRDDWEESIKDNINELIRRYKNDNNYVVFDFDNTTCIFDIEEQLIVYQLETMSFNLNPDELESAISTGLNLSTSINGYGYFSEELNLTYSDLITDIKNDYSYLYDKYGAFSSLGLSEENKVLIDQEDKYKDFRCKMRLMYDLACDIETTEVSYPWITYWFSGMNEFELYEFAYRSHSYYKEVETEIVEWSTEGVGSLTGSCSIKWTKGITVSENLKELYKAFTKNGIDVWVCSASAVDVVRAAVDAFGLHDICKGVIGMTNVLVDGKYISEYDYVNGVGYYTGKDGSWEKMERPIKTQTQAEGKVVAIKNALVPEYNKGPIAGFGDSTGDFNFCSEFDSLKLVVFFNRANRKLTDGGGLIACVAMYQKDVLGYDLGKAIENGDTLYLLQGRDENSYRTLRNSNKTLVYATQDERLFRGQDNFDLLNYITLNNLSTKDILNTFSIYSKESNLGFEYGFFDEYIGYHSIKDVDLKGE